MELDEIRIRLKAMKDKADRARRLIAREFENPSSRHEAELLARSLKEELRGENTRISHGSIARELSPDESAYYRPSIHGAWAAISGLRVDAAAKKAWYSPLEETSYRLGKYI